MLRKDTLLFEIQKINQALARIVGLKKDGATQEAHTMANDVLLREFSIDKNFLESGSVKDLEAQVNGNTYTPEKLDLLAQLIFESAHPFEDTPECANRLHLTLSLYNILEHDHHIQSLNNLAKRQMIDHFLNNQQYE